MAHMAAKNARALAKATEDWRQAVKSLQHEAYDKGFEDGRGSRPMALTFGAVFGFFWGGLLVWAFFKFTA